MIDDGLAPDDDLLPEDPAEMLLGAVKFDALSPTAFEAVSTCSIRSPLRR